VSHALRVGVADQIGYFRAYNTDGSAKTDLTSSTTGLTLSVFRVGAAAVSISSLSAKAADNTAHADGAIRAVSGNLYTVDLPDAACADQVPSISVKGSYTGGVIEGPEHPLIGYNPATVAVGALTPLVAGRQIAVAETTGKVNAELDSSSRLAIWNTLTTETFTADSFGELLLISDGTNGRAVKVTGANHIAADVHDCQADGLSGSTEITAIKAKTDNLPSDPADASDIASSFSAVNTKLDTIDDFLDTEVAAIKVVTDRINTGLVLDGAVYQFTANMLELAPAGGGGGGSGDATLAKQEEILAQLDVIQTKTDTIGSVGAITSLLAAAVLEPGTITSFPETLTIGDSYTEQNGREIQIPIVDTDGNPISSTGSLNFADASVTFTLQRSGETDSTRVITGTATFVDPPGTGTGDGAPYAVIELPASETAKGLKKYKYSGILTFLWTYAGTGTADDVMSFETGTVTFEGQ
jgi:hypothetical protein